MVTLTSPAMKTSNSASGVRVMVTGPTVSTLPTKSAVRPCATMTLGLEIALR
ncbi:MAG: hypothetical protein HY901_35560 [Deltaproteobacteria bacterium]|nr:hypothetical protein [Deltaproteobacteria bacterium]